MQEEKLLNKTFGLLDSDGPDVAYKYLQNNIDDIDELSAQVYNFLYCLASMNNKKMAALDWMMEAIVEKKMWYRPEVFTDVDLNNIRSNVRFSRYMDISKKRYKRALEETKTIVTWKIKKNDNLMLVLHGNQQNISIAKNKWDVFNSEKYQVEYLQSKELDSYNLFRWEDKGSGPSQLEKAVKFVDWEKYDRRIICGFSAGCNVILRSLIEKNIDCEKIILQSPWIPVIEESLEDIIKILRKNKIEVLIICGVEDEDCFPLAKNLSIELEKNNVNIKYIWINGIDHQYPDNFEEIVVNFLEI